MRMPRFLFRDNTYNASWGEIIIEIILCALCPFLLIPYWLIRSLVEKNKINTQNILIILFVIAMIFVLIASPIVTIKSILSYGFANTFKKIGCLFAIDIIEIHLSLWLVWNSKIKKKINVKEKNVKPFSLNEHPYATILYILGFCTLFFVFIFANSINNFWAFIILIYGTFFLIKGLK